MQKLVSWKSKPERKPLILSGVRQAGKTYVLKQFGHKNFKQLHYINFEKQNDACAIFNATLDPKQLINGLCFFLQTQIDIENDLVFFDEIQACPRALTSLKYFCEDLPELALCSAGSLLGLHLNVGSYPVGKVDMLHLYPMSYSEFLAGIGHDYAANYLENINIKANTPVTEIIHQQLWHALKLYFITGGLPEVVMMFAKHQENLFQACQIVREKQQELINAYYADIAKHAGKVNAMHIDRTWRAVPIQLANVQDSNINRFRFKDIIPGINRYTQLVNVIDWLDSTELIIKIPLVETVEQPLLAYTKDNSFKLMMFDVGILGAMSGLDPKVIIDYDYGTYKGYFAENFVAQQLQHSSQSIFSWQKHRAEVEFLFQHQGNIIPVEVKSGKVTRSKSLQKYIETYQPQTSCILSANNFIDSDAAGILRLPLYLVEKLV